MAYKLFLDTNVFLDAFLERTADWNEAETILQLAAQNKIDLFTSANNLVNVIYSLKKQRLTQEEIIKLLELTLTYTHLADITKAAFAHALRAGFSDLEDAVQYHTALHIKGIDYFISSNTKDFKKATTQLPVVTPRQFMALYNK